MRHRGKKDKNIFTCMVGATGFEPVTPAVSRQCSTAELHTQYSINYSKLKIYTITFLNQVKQFKNYAKK